MKLNNLKLKNDWVNQEITAKIAKRRTPRPQRKKEIKHFAIFAKKLSVLCVYF
jgi:hypothetical protein